MIFGKKFWRCFLTSTVELSAKHHLTNACSLAYTTLLSLIPLISIIIYVGSFSGAFSEYNTLAKHYAIDNLLPSASADVVSYIDTFSQQANHVPAISLFFLLITAILLMRSIDSTMSLVWDKKRKRKVVPWLIYVVSIVAIPIVIALVVMLSTILSQFAYSIPYLSNLTVIVPLAVNAIMLYFLYQLTAGRQYKTRQLLLGAVVASILLALIKTGFSIYISDYSNYQDLYGALSIVPVFLIWLFILWAVVIYGALFAKNIA